MPIEEQFWGMYEGLPGDIRQALLVHPVFQQVLRDLATQRGLEYLSTVLFALQMMKVYARMAEGRRL